MKRKKALSLLTALAMVLSLFAPSRAFAATYRASTWMSAYNGGWEHDEKNLLNGWHFQSDSRQMVFTYYPPSGGQPVEAVYCIAPSNARHTGDYIEEFTESYITSQTWNNVLSGTQVKDLLSYVLYFGYTGQVSTTDSRWGNIPVNEPAVLKAFDEALATQLAVWEVIVGERNADFTKRSAGGSDTVLSIVKTSMPGYNEYFLPKYNAIVNSVTQMLKVPSFLSGDQGSALRSKMEWNGSQYSVTLTDTNNCLDGWSFSGSGLTFSVSGNRLTITAPTLLNSDDLLITATRNITGRSMVIQTNADAATYSIGAIQPTAVPGTPVSTRKTAYVKAYGDAMGYATLTKSSSGTAMTNGNSSYSLNGITFGIYTNQGATALAKDTRGNDAILTVNADGTANTVTLLPGSYFVKEISVPAGSGYKLSTEVYPLTVSPNQTAMVRATDLPLNDPAGLVINKVDENGNVIAGANMAGAQYTLKFYAGQYTKTDLPATPDATWVIETKNVGGSFIARLSDDFHVSGDTAKYGKDSTSGQYIIPLGTLTIQETKAPDGFKIEGSTMQLAGGNGSDATDGIILFNLVDRSSAVTVLSGNQAADASEGFGILQKEQRIPVTATVKKVDGAGNPIAGVVFNLNGPDPDGVVRDHRASTDARGFATWTNLPYGVQATLYEISAPAGYKLDPTAAAGITKTLTGTLSGNTYVYDLGTITNQTDGGKVTVKKASEGATLSGFTFSLSGTSTLGETISKTATTTANGIADFGFIPSGTYTVRETNVPDYMSVSPASQTVTVASADVEVTFSNTLLYGTVNVTKTFATISDAAKPADLSGFTFRIGGTSLAGTTVNMTATTDASGKASFANVPYGTYSITEELTADQALVWKAKSAGSVTVSASATTVSYQLENEPQLGTVNVNKTLGGGETASLAGFVFRLTGTSDAGYVVDKTATTDASGKAIFTNVPFGTYSIKEELTADQAKIWKTKDAETVKISSDEPQVTYSLMNEALTQPVKVMKTSDNGTVEGFTFTLSGTRAIGGAFEAQAVTNAEGVADFGEVPFGTYTVTETLSYGQALEFLSDGPWTITVDAASESPYVIKAHNPHARIETDAADAETGIGVSRADGSVTVNDTVHYYNLVPGATYKIVGTVMDPETKEVFRDASGKEVTQTGAFVADTKDGTFVVSFSFDATGFAGKTLVVFEEMWRNDVFIAEHKDLEDDAQTIYLPAVTTDAKDDATEMNHAEAASAVTVVDTVTYSTLRPGKEYTVKGTLMDKATGKPLTVNGKEVTAEKTFTPDEPDGTVELAFTFDASSIAGTTVVVFETVSYEEAEVAVHADIEDEAQTIYIPEIGTTAVAADTGDHVTKAAGDVTIHDTVTYRGLEADRAYTVQGVLMDKASGEALTVDGKEVTAEATFTAEKADGSVELAFIFDGTGLAGTTVVAFETLYTEEKEVAVHADIEDEKQTVYIPKVTTDARDQATETDHAEASEKTTIIDTVTYKNLLPGKEYNLQGVLMNKATNEPILVNARKVTAETNFTPETSDGTIELSFTFDASALAGTTVVVFESIYCNEIEVAVHADIEDEDQTVYIPKIGTVATALDTGDHLTGAFEEVTIIDTVAYEGLKAGTTYTVKGVLMDKKTGQAILADGKEVTAETTFTADKADGSVKLTFTFNGTGLEGSTAVAFETLYLDGASVAVHADLTDEDQSVHFPGIKTTLRDQVTGTDHATAGQITLIDTVRYNGLIPGREYVLTGTLMDKASGKAILADGKEVTATTAFTPDTESGDVDVVFTFDASSLAGQAVVAFETLCSEGIKVAVHADIEDEAQTVYIPEVTTDAKDKGTGTDHAKAGEDLTIIDTVTYKGLKVGAAYVVKGILMDKETGKALLMGGKEVTAEASFTAEMANGTVELAFTFDGSLVAGKTIVVFETLYNKDNAVAAHAEIEDESQTVYVPEILTTAVFKDGDKIGEAKEEVTVVDRVDYKGLKVGAEYTLEGILMVVETGEPFLDSGKEVTASLSFQAEKSEGFVELEFTFDASALKGQTIVVYEKLKNKTNKVAAHENLSDLDQSVYFPEITTEAEDAPTGTKTVSVSRTASIVDVVTYKGVEPGRKYTVKGVLMDQESGEALLIDGKEISAETAFTPKTSEGTVEVVFTFDATLLAGKNLVVFETLYTEDRQIADHSDINDESQTVTVPTILTKAAETKSGQKELLPEGNVSITDVIRFTGLCAGKTYTTVGVMMDKESGRPLTIGGKEVRAEVRFIPGSSEGTVQVTFSFNAASLGGRTLVAFQKILLGDTEVASHEDLTDADQSVTFTKLPAPDTGEPGGLLLPLICFLAAGSLAGCMIAARQKKKQKKDDAPKKQA